MERVSLAEIMHVHTSGGRAMAAGAQMGIHRDETSGALEEDGGPVCMWYSADLGAAEAGSYSAPSLVH